MLAPPALVVFSHLRWGFVFQRPHHILTRLARTQRVIFLEEPVHDASAEPHWESNTPADNVTVYRLHTPLAEPGFCDAQMPLLERSFAALIRDERLRGCRAWFYTPLALPLLAGLDPEVIVYDCMDELSAFLNAPPKLVRQERELLRQADVVFTGGPSLYQAKRDRHPNVHCFPSSVDAGHFGQARAGLAEAEDQAPLGHPRLGYFGVIDERIDLPALMALADAKPDWEVVMVGPIVKIDPATLPRRPNLHYFGARDYADLPRYLAGWDVCLLPFARNAATRYISPTKTLEYMAAERPIASTPITDILEPYGDIAYFGDTPEAFLAACEQALHEQPAERARRTSRMREVLAQTSWDETVAAMERLMETASEKRSTRLRKAGPGAVSEPTTLLTPAARSACGSTAHSQPPGTPPVIVVGAGPTGLSAAYHLGEEALLLEQNATVGGWCRSIQVNGFTFDFAGHIMFSNDPYVHELYQLLLGENVHWQDREAWVYSKQVYTRYPFQGALYGLPPQVIKECIVGAIEARYGKLNEKARGVPPAPPNGKHVAPGRSGSQNGSMPPATIPLRNGKECRTENLSDCCADGLLESSAPLGLPGEASSSNGEPRNFEEFIYRVWGAGIARHFAIPYNQKLWAVPLSEMETSWLGGRVPLPDLEEMIEGALQPVPKPMGPNARFGYPLRGGFQALMNGFLPHLKGVLRTNAKVASVSPSRHELTLTDGSVLPYETLISTMPLPVLIRSMGGEAPPEVQRAAAGLRYVSVRCVHLGVGREDLTDKHWIYYPEETVFHRIFVQGNASPHCNPPGGFGLTCEITYSPHKPLPVEGDALVERCIADCHKVGFFRPSDPIWATAQVDMPHAYVVYDHARKAHVAVLRAWLARHDIILAGRYSEWEYYNSDHAFLAGKKAAESAGRLRGNVRIANSGG